MSREVKFRAWCEGLGSFITPSDSFSLVLHDTGNRVQMWGSDGIVDEFPATSIDQYTGLKDKNGVEIYEGDIIDGLVVTYTGDLEGSLGMNCGWYLQRDDFESFTELVCEQDNEVIGNIYENPELLGGN
jgi:uncharacterized phage protein (TIGR01671 family)